MRTPISHPLDEGICGGCMDGHSTLWWATTDAEVYSVDISEENVILSSKICKTFKNVHIIKQDGIDF